MLVRLSVSAIFGLATGLDLGGSQAEQCRCFPGDSCWPSGSEWSSLDSDVGGRLIQTTPLAETCRDPFYYASACNDLKTKWPLPDPHYESPPSIWAPLYQKKECTPFAEQEDICTMTDNYVSYSVAAISADDVIATVNFARDNNIRLVIKSSGHDLLGKSTGAGALGLWTHKLKDVNFIDRYSSSYFNGPAVKIGAGVQGNEIMQAAADRGRRVLAGACSGISPAGGYAQGGGHSMLATKYGLAADNVLEWEVVTSDGRLVTASPTTNKDLYWALSGGGGSTYGAVVSMTAKTFPDGPVGSVNVTMNPSATNPDLYWDAVTSFHTHSLKWTESGAALTAFFSANAFQLFPLTVADGSAQEALALVQPWLDDLDALEVTYTVDSFESSNYLQHFIRYFGPLPYGTIWLGQVQSGRFVPKDTVENNLGALIDTYRQITENGPFLVSLTGIDVSHTPKVAPNAVNPKWRELAHEMFVFSPWDYKAPGWESNYAVQKQLTDVVDPLLLDLMPESGAYLNQANPQHATWKKDFYGVNYDRLRSIKGQVDEADLFYAPTAVGSDEWTVASGQRLCKVGKDVDFTSMGNISSTTMGTLPSTTIGTLSSTTMGNILSTT